MIAREQLIRPLFAGVTAVVLSTAGSAGALAQPNRTIAARDLATLSDLGGLSVSPDGAWAAFQVRKADPDTNSYRADWYVLSLRGGPARRIAEAGTPIAPVNRGRINGTIVTPAPIWSTDRAWIVYLRKDREFVQLWRSRLDGTRTEQLTRNAGTVRVSEVGAHTFVFSRDGLRLLYETEPTAAEVAAGLQREGRAGFLYDRRFFPSYSHRPILPANIVFGSRASDDQKSTGRIWVYELANKRERLASESEKAEFAALTAAPKPAERAAFRGIARASDAVGLAWTEARDPERQGAGAPLTVVAHRNRDKAPLVCAAIECTGQIKDLWWRNEREILFARMENVHRETALYAWRPGDAAVRLVLRTPDTLVGAPYQWSCDIARDRLVCFHEQTNYPQRLVAVDIRTGAVETLFDPNPDFAGFNLGSPPRRLDFRPEAGVETFGYLVLPPGNRSNGRLPLAIVTYRCDGFLRGGIGDEYPVFPFAAQGLAVLCFNVPDGDAERRARMTSTEYSRWERGPGDPIKHRVQTALDAAIACLVAKGIVDADRVGLTGLSFGAETVSFALFNSTQITAAIASGTEIGPSSTFLYGPAGRELLASLGLGSPLSERWRTLSLSRNAARVRAPLLLNASDHEMVSAVEVVAALEDEQRTVELYVLPDEFHIKYQPAHRLAIYERNIDWLNFWLSGVEDSDPAKADQYKRWRAMREKQCALFKGNEAPSYAARCVDESALTREVKAR